MLVALKRAEGGGRGEHENEEAIWEVGRKAGMSRAMVNRIIHEMYWRCGTIPPARERREGSEWFKAIHNALHFHKIYYETNFADPRDAGRAARYVRNFPHNNVEKAFIRANTSCNPLLFEKFVTSVFENELAPAECLKILFPKGSELPNCSVLRTADRRGFIIDSRDATQKLRELDRMNFCLSLMTMRRRLHVQRVISSETEKHKLIERRAHIFLTDPDGSTCVLQDCQITPFVEMLYQIGFGASPSTFTERARILSDNQKRFEAQGVVPRLQIEGDYPILKHEEAILFAKQPTLDLFLPMRREYATSEVGLTMLMKTVSCSTVFGGQSAWELDRLEDMVARLLKGNADPNKADLVGRTALAYMCRSLYKVCDKIGPLLFKHGAKINVANVSPDGVCRTPLDFVFLDDIDIESDQPLVNPRTILYLLRHGARILVADIRAKVPTRTYDLYLLAVALGPPNYANNASIRGLTNDLIFMIGDMLAPL